MAYNPYYNNPYFPQQQGYYNNGAMLDMLNQMKGQYQQPMMQQPMQTQMPNIQPTAPQTNQSNDIIWVQGEAGAKAYLVAPNNTVTLWDSESPTIYLKTADSNGVPSMRVLDFTERTANAPKTPEKHDCQCGDKFATKEQLTALEGKYDEIIAIVDELKAKPVKKTTKASEE